MSLYDYFDTRLQEANVQKNKEIIEEIRTRPDMINSLLHTSLKEIESMGKIRVYLHPEDYEFLLNSGLNLDQFLKEEQSLIIKSDSEAIPGSIYMESDEEAINFNFQKRFEELEQALNEELSERHARLSEVDIDAHDFEKITSIAAAPTGATFFSAPGVFVFLTLAGPNASKCTSLSGTPHSRSPLVIDSIIGPGPQM